jgi:hypothetical protein
VSSGSDFWPASTAMETNSTPLRWSLTSRKCMSPKTNKLQFSSSDRIYSTVEVNLAIICSCMIFFPSFVRTSKTGAESALRYLLSKTGNSRSRVQVSGSDEQPPPPSSDSADWQKFQAPTTFEAELREFGYDGHVLKKEPTP